MLGFGESVRVELRLSTRKARHIRNSLCTDPLDPGMHTQCESYKRLHPAATHRPAGPCQSYNCHGLTFASRRTMVTHSDEVQKILEDDGYVEINLSVVLAGDIAVYRADALDGGEIEHSGLVIDKPRGVGGLIGSPLILSKWGQCQEVIHLANDSPYNGSNIKYYRLRS